MGIRCGIVGRGLALCLILCGTAAADDDEMRRVFERGLALESAGDWGNALARFEQIVTVHPTPQVRFHMAHCQEELGKWTEALGSYRLALDGARATATEAMVSEIDAASRRLDAQVPKLRIVRTDVSGPPVALDGALIGGASLGQVFRVDPGRHVVTIGVGDDSRELTVTLAPGEELAVNVDIPKVPASQPVPLRDTSKAHAFRGRALSYAAVGLGTAGVAAGVVFALLRQQTIDTLNSSCSADHHCAPSLRSTYSQGQAFTDLAVASFALGAAGLATGAYLWLSVTPPSRASGSASFYGMTFTRTF